ncbi:hypothetical protein BH11ACT7_BH11ACT7_05840 [soil metagenome]
MLVNCLTQRGHPAPRHRVVAVGASAGGVEALIQLAAGLPRDCAYAVVVVLHLSAEARNLLAAIITRSGPLPAVTVTRPEQLLPGHIYVAPAGHHLLVAGRRAVLSDQPAEHGHRPSINALFRSVASEYHEAGVGVLLSGMLDDGVAGLAAIKACGGITVVQRPDEALYPDMPRNALAAGVADYAAGAKEIGTLLNTLGKSPA